MTLHDIVTYYIFSPYSGHIALSEQADVKRSPLSSKLKRLRCKMPISSVRLTVKYGKALLVMQTNDI
uniref:HTH lysR-type domain-containing protein n=1 Tax=Steinernema glaseri TaxID=37863 RepID=A0A1I7Y6X4_9BILA